MQSHFNFIADRVVKKRIYPALSRHQARPYTQNWREFGRHWPYTTPLRVEEYCQQHGIDINIYSIDDRLPNHTYYPICLGFFDFDIDYLDLLPQAVKQRLRNQDFRLLFFYHEGDNPQRIKHRLDTLTQQHGLHPDCYIFVTANSSGAALPGFVVFHDFEFWYYQRNLTSQPRNAVKSASHDFTCLVRSHRWWRATLMADLWREHLLDNSFWSYGEPATGDDTQCPIEVDLVPRLRYDRDRFLQTLPRTCDDLSQDQHNDHGITVEKYFQDSWCNIVIESQFDVDQSNGVFITEKTFKPIKHGQMFFVAGAAGTLQCLRDLGYRVFDGILDNSYDREANHTMRAQLLRDSIAAARPHLESLHQQAMPDILHNQKLFCSNKADRLNTLIRGINAQYH